MSEQPELAQDPRDEALRIQNHNLMYKRALDAWKPPVKLTVAEWAEKHYAHEKGTLRLIGFQRGFLDAFSDPSVERITLKKSARVGATMSMVIACVYYAAQDPQHLMLVQPTDDDCRGISTDHIGPSYERTPQTVKLFKNNKNTRNTLTHKVFPGGSLKILAAKSPRNLRRHDVDVLMLDEVDGYETTVEGDPIELAIRRTQNSARRKIFMGSTPVNAQTSKVCASWEDSDKRFYYVPCPCCGAAQTLDWDHMYIDGTKVTKMKLRDLDLSKDFTAHMRCKECGEDIHEEKKAWMVEEGEWVATEVFRGHAGFHINTLYSTFPNASWQNLVMEYLRAKRSPDTLQTFVNTVLGLEWKDNLDDIDEETVAKRRGKYNLDTVPADVLMITCGVDVQKDRAEISYLGHCEDGRIKVLAHTKLYGDPTGSKLWDDLDNLLKVEYTHELGGQIGISATAVDSGNWTQHVYDYCAGKQGQGIYAIKGTPGNRPIWAESKIKAVAKLYNVGVDTAKTILMQRLTVDEPEEAGYIEFTQDFEFEYFEELLSEYRKVEYVAGRPKFTWERKPGRRAEALDCFVYGMAAFTTLAPNWDTLRDRVTALDRQENKKTGLSALGAMANSMQS